MSTPAICGILKKFAYFLRKLVQQQLILMLNSTNIVKESHDLSSLTLDKVNSFYHSIITNDKIHKISQ